MDHLLNDENGGVVCPILSSYTCPFCHRTGNEAHTKKYCPEKKIITQEDTEAIEALKKEQPLEMEN
jgi:hypothetical protein